jgi:hypothetical protein
MSKGKKGGREEAAKSRVRWKDGACLRMMAERRNDDVAGP